MRISIAVIILSALAAILLAVNASLGLFSTGEQGSNN